MRLSLQFKIIAPIVVLNIVVFALQVVAFHDSLQKTIRDEFSSKGLAIVQSLSSSVQDTLLNRDASTIQGFIDQYRVIAGVEYIYIKNEKGEIVSHTFEPYVPRQFLFGKDPALAHIDSADTKETHERTIEFEGFEVLDVYTPILAGLLGSVHIGMGIQKQEEAVLWPLVWKLVFSRGMLAAFGLFISSVILILAIKPILRLTEVTRRVAENGELDVQIEVDQNDEVGDLSRSLQVMLNRLSQRTEDLKKSNRDLEQFAYIASHDLQEPLRMVASYLQLVARKNKGKLDADTDEFIEFAVDGATRMKGMINALLEYSRVGISNENFENLDANKLMGAVEKNLEVRVKEMNAKIVYNDLPEVFGDKTFLERLFQNIVGNAIKFNESETPTVEIRAVEIQEKGQWQFEIHDNGIGIDEDFHDRIFQIFQRLHQKSEFEGTGIGLSVCKRIVEIHGGQIWLESKPGAGTIFYFTLSASKDVINQEIPAAA